MSSDKIKLPNFVIADLYKSSLVHIAGGKQAKNVIPESEEIKEIIADAQSSTPDTGIKYLGDNKRRVAIVVNQPGTVFIKEEDLTFLTNILKACQLSLPDIAIVNVSTAGVTYTKLKDQLQSKHILLFDVEASTIKLPFIIPAFQVQQYDNLTIMMAPALSTLNSNSPDGKLLKTKLWLGLKQAFNI